MGPVIEVKGVAVGKFRRIFVVGLLIGTFVFFLVPKVIAEYLIVDLKTNYLPVEEFSSIQILLEGERERLREVRPGDDFLHGVRIAEYDVSKNHNYRLRVNLLQPDGSVLPFGQRTVLIDFRDRALAVTALISRRDEPPSEGSGSDSEPVIQYEMNSTVVQQMRNDVESINIRAGIADEEGLLVSEPAGSNQDEEIPSEDRRPIQPTEAAAGLEAPAPIEVASDGTTGEAQENKSQDGSDFAQVITEQVSGGNSNAISGGGSCSLIDQAAGTKKSFALDFYFFLIPITLSIFNTINKFQKSSFSISNSP